MRRYYRVRQITEIFGPSKGKIFLALKTGALKGEKLDGTLLIPAESVEAWIATAVPYKPEAETQEGER